MNTTPAEANGDDEARNVPVEFNPLADRMLVVRESARMAWIIYPIPGHEIERRPNIADVEPHSLTMVVEDDDPSTLWPRYDGEPTGEELMAFLGLIDSIIDLEPGAARFFPIV